MGIAVARHAGRKPSPFHFEKGLRSMPRAVFIEASIRNEHCFENEELPDQDICSIVNWLADRSAAEVGAFKLYFQSNGRGKSKG